MRNHGKKTRSHKLKSHKPKIPTPPSINSRKSIWKFPTTGNFDKQPLYMSHISTPFSEVDTIGLLALLHSFRKFNQGQEYFGWKKKYHTALKAELATREHIKPGNKLIR